MTANQAPHFRTTQEAGCTTVSFPPGATLSEEQLDALSARLPLLSAASGHCPLAIDLSGVAAVSSGALGKLLGLARAARAAEGRVVLVNPPPAVRRVLRVTRLDTLLEVRSAEPATA